MSEAQAKATPSKAAMELAEKIYRHAELTWFKSEQTQDEAAVMIDLALADLLEKAEDTLSYRTRLMDDDSLRMGKLREALEPWKPK